MAFWTFGFPKVAPAPCVAPTKILSACHSLQMARVETRGVLTKVIDFEAVRDRSHQQLVRETMSETLAAVTNSDEAVAVGEGARPVPTSGVAVFGDPGEEAILDVHDAFSSGSAQRRTVRAERLIPVRLAISERMSSKDLEGY